MKKRLSYFNWNSTAVKQTASIFDLLVGNSETNPSPKVKNLGCWLDTNLRSMSIHITNVCKSAFFHIYNLRRIKKYLTRDCLLTLVHALITSIFPNNKYLSYNVYRMQQLG